MRLARNDTRRGYRQRPCNSLTRRGRKTGYSRGLRAGWRSQSGSCGRAKSFFGRHSWATTTGMSGRPPLRIARSTPLAAGSGRFHPPAGHGGAGGAYDCFPARASCPCSPIGRYTAGPRLRSSDRAGTVRYLPPVVSATDLKKEPGVCSGHHHHNCRDDRRPRPGR